MCGAVLAGILCFPPASSADIYLSRDASGVLHFTNAPAAPSRMVIKERPLPPARRMMVYQPRPLPLSIPGSRSPPRGRSD
jgi:hypothetical protein